MEEVLEQEVVNEEVKEITLSDEDMDLLRKSIRPDWMPQDIFREIRKRGDQVVKDLLKGKFIHISSEIRKEKVDKTIYKTDEVTGERVKDSVEIEVNRRFTAKPYRKPK